MSNRPPALCNIKKGKALGAQENFADTFNWLTSCVDNLTGGTGIKVDWPATDTPTISVDQDFLNSAVNGGGGGGGRDGSKFHFPVVYNDEVESEEEEVSNDNEEEPEPRIVIGIGSGAIQVGGYTLFVRGGVIQNRTSDENYIVCAKVKLSTMSFDGFYAYPSESDIRSEQNDMEYYIFPLYKIVDGLVDIDYRPLPNAGCWEDTTYQQGEES